MATLTRAMLADLNKGCSTIKVIDVPASPTTVEDYDFHDADIFLTKAGSFEITQDELSTTEYKLDQGDEVYDTEIEKGENKMTGFIPSTAEAVMNFFFNSGDATSRDIKINSSTADYEGKGYEDSVKQFYKAVAVVSETGNTALLFTNVKMSGILSEEDGYRGVSFTGAITPSGKTGIATFYNLSKKS